MLSLPISVLVVHFIADFLLQSDWMAVNKSKSNAALTAHVTVYAACFLVFGIHFAAVTFYLHWITDYFTSRWTSKLWFFKYVCSYCGEPWDTHDCGKVDGPFWTYVHSKRHWFFVVIGLDQLIHFFTLAVTYAVWG